MTKTKMVSTCSSWAFACLCIKFGLIAEAAEDYYGNDYPEDELESDDEFGRNAYKYRENASEDEEYDEDLNAWSDDNGVKYLP